MSWTLVLALAAIAYGFKLVGLVVIGGTTMPLVVERCLGLVPAALISALIIHDTFSSSGTLVVDARSIGVGMAALVAWRRAPLVVVIIVGAAVTALVRAFGLLP